MEVPYPLAEANTDTSWLFQYKGSIACRCLLPIGLRRLISASRSRKCSLFGKADPAGSCTCAGRASKVPEVHVVGLPARVLQLRRRDTTCYKSQFRYAGDGARMTAS